MFQVAANHTLRDDIYDGRAPSELLLYTPYEAARYVGLPKTTAYKWLEAESRIVGLSRSSRRLNFKNLLELYVLNALRRHHLTPLGNIRRAVAYLKSNYKTEYPLAELPLETDGDNVLIQEVGKVINLSESGQLEFEEIVIPYLKRIDRGPDNQALRVYPITSKEAAHQRIVSIDPVVQFGRPCIAGTRVKTEILLERSKAGDSVAVLAKDYGLSARKISEALKYEQGAA